MATTFVRPTLDAVLDAAVSSGVHGLQFDLACAGEPTLPMHIDAALCDRIRRACATRHLTMAARSGTFNMIHPDPRQRAAGLAGLRTLLSVCGALGVSVVTLCTGTRDVAHMWRRHPANDTPEAWTDGAHDREMVMGKLDGIPAAIVRGLVYERGEGSARELIRPPEQDMFR